MKTSQLSRTLCIAVALIALPAAFAQGQTHSKSIIVPERTAAASGLTVDDVIKMSKAGLADGIIVQEIRKNGQAFDLNPDQLIQLKTAAVSDRVITVMMDPSKPDAPALAAPAAAASTQAAIDPSLPTEIGVYAKKQGKWTEVLPEVVNWKTGGVFKSIASAGIVKGDINGHLEGANSRNSFTTPIEFLIVAPEGTAITEYQLLRLRPSGQNLDSREFRTVTGGVMHVSGGATRDLVPFEGKKIAPHVYGVIFPSNLGAGEYGFLPPGAIGATNAAGSTGRLYSFRVIE
jgi:hypothetical protein